MKSGVTKTIMVIATVLLIFTVFVIPRAEAASAVGKVTRMTGQVKLNRAGKMLNVGVGTRVMPGDVVQTQTGSVKILMSDSSVLSLGSNSKMRIRSYSHNPRTRKTAANYDLVYGRGRARVPKRAGASRDIRFRTPGAVAGVRGTELIFEYDPATGQTRIIAVDGEVTIVNPNNPNETITLTPGMGITVGADGSLSSPYDVPMDEIIRLRQEAHVPGSSPRRVIVVNVPGTGDGEIIVSVDVTPGGPVIQIILGDSGTVINPEDLLDQEPPPFTPVEIRLNVETPQ